MAMRLAVPPPPDAAPSSVIQGERLALCDATASGAEDAQVRLARGKVVLDLCSHHFRELEFVLAVSGWQVTHDNRGRLR